MTQIRFTWPYYAKTLQLIFNNLYDGYPLINQFYKYLNLISKVLKLKINIVNCEELLFIFTQRLNFDYLG